MMMKSRDLWLAFVLLFKIDALAPAVRSGFRHAAARGHGVALRAADVECDLVVIGAGPVGTRAAIRGAERGARVVLIDGNPARAIAFGGPTGLFSKALRDTAKRVPIAAYRELGMESNALWTQIRADCVRLAQSNARAVTREVEASGAVTVRGEACLQSADDAGVVVRVTDDAGDVVRYSSKFALLASGSEPFRPPNVPFDGERVFDSDSINGLQFLPRSVAITGSGIIAIEFAKIFRTFGVDVTLIIRDSHPKNALEKSGIDKDLAAVLVSDLVRSGVQFAKGSVCGSIEVPKSGADGRRQPIRIELLQSGTKPDAPPVAPRTIKADIYMAAVGRRPRTASLGLEAVGVAMDTFGNIVVDADMRTSLRSIGAAGDAVGRPFLASTGVAQGISAVSRMFPAAPSAAVSELESGRSSASLPSECGASFDPSSLAANPFAFPVGIWSSPEVAYFGLTLAQARARGVDADEGMALYKECLRGVVFSPEGLLKLVYDRTDGKIIGVHIVGSDACEMIHYGMELVRAQRTVNDVTAAMYSAVTFHELYQIAARACFDPKGARLRRRAAGKAFEDARVDAATEATLWR